MNTTATAANPAPNLTDRPLGHRPSAKQAAVIGDSLYPMPRRLLLARDILDQAGLEQNVSLVRDYNSPFDGILADDTEVDLAKGNVFLTCPKRAASRADEVAGELPKLAFVVDDVWKVTVTPNQTGRTLRHLFGLPEGVELLRDYESPHDEPIAEGDALHFGDGPVFRTERISVTVEVNNRPVNLAKRRATGLEIKQAAVAQGVAIKPDFALYALKPDGGLGPVIHDGEQVALHEGDKFRALTTDDNS